MCGFRSCIARMLLTCFTVNGKRRLRTITVSITIESHQATPSDCLKKSSTPPRMLTIGPKTLWKKSAMLLIIRSYSSYWVESSPRERVATQHPHDAHEDAPRYAVFLYGLQRVQGAARCISARRRQHGGEVGTVEPNKSYARPSQKHIPPSNRPAPDRAADLAQRLTELFPKLLKRRLGGRWLSRHHEVQFKGGLGDIRVKHFPEPPPHSVSCCRIADLPGYREAQPGSVIFIGEGVHREELAPVGGALTIDPLELRRVSQTHALAAWQRSDCKALAAPTPAIRDDPAPANRTHAFAEAVRLGSFATIWLISTLH